MWQWDLNFSRNYLSKILFSTYGQPQSRVLIQCLCGSGFQQSLLMSFGRCQLTVVGNVREEQEKLSVVGLGCARCLEKVSGLHVS